MASVRPKRLKKRQTGRVGAVEAEFFNGLLGEILVSSGALTPHELERVLAQQDSAPQPPPPLGTLLVEEQLVAPPVVSAALHKQKQS